MDDRNRPHFPVSQGTLISHVREFGVIRYTEGNNSDTDGSLDDDVVSSDGSATSDDIVDDTDEDPTWEINTTPSLRFSFTNSRQLGLGLDQPGTSGVVQQPNVGLVIQGTDDYSSSDESSVCHRPMPTRVDLGLSGVLVMGLGQFINEVGLLSARSLRPDSSEWEVIEEENVRGYTHNFDFVELSGPKHCPPINSHPTAYFYFVFYGKST